MFTARQCRQRRRRCNEKAVCLTDVRDVAVVEGDLGHERRAGPALGVHAAVSRGTKEMTSPV